MRLSRFMMFLSATTRREQCVTIVRDHESVDGDGTKRHNYNAVPSGSSFIRTHHQRNTLMYWHCREQRLLASGFEPMILGPPSTEPRYSVIMQLHVQSQSRHSRKRSPIRADLNKTQLEKELPLVTCSTGADEVDASSMIFVGEEHDRYSSGNWSGWSFVQPLALAVASPMSGKQVENRDVSLAGWTADDEDAICYNLKGCFPCLLPTSILSTPSDSLGVLVRLQFASADPLKVLDESPAANLALRKFLRRLAAENPVYRRP